MAPFSHHIQFKTWKYNPKILSLSFLERVPLDINQLYKIQVPVKRFWKKILWCPIQVCALMDLQILSRLSSKKKTHWDCLQEAVSSFKMGLPIKVKSSSSHISGILLLNLTGLHHNRALRHLVKTRTSWTLVNQPTAHLLVGKKFHQSNHMLQLLDSTKWKIPPRPQEKLNSASLQKTLNS